MSRIVNDGNRKPGTIYRISLKDFVTYKTVELFPGSSLNLIIGPNGTGKSTFVCAIILGLCGKTNAIGRANKISEFVRSGCQEAIIEIELYQKPGKNNVIITRIFNLKDVSYWKLNNVSVREKQVQELMTSLNIQVDNLCQLLPQDKVQDFSNMNPQKLLRSTLLAAGTPGSVAQLDEMIEWRTQHKTLATRLSSNAKILEEQKQLNERLKTVIDSMQQRQQIEYEITMCEKKKLWIEYHELRQKVGECTKDRQEANKLLDSHKRQMAPLEEVLNKAKSNISKLEQMKIKSNREIHEQKDKIKPTLQTIKQQEYKLKQIEDRYNDLLERHENKEREIYEAKAVLNKLQVDKVKLIENVGDETKVNMDLAVLHKSIHKTHKAIEKLKSEKFELENTLNNEVKAPMRMHANKIRQLQDMDAKRLNSLRDTYSQCYQAVQWLREHKADFKHQVFEPMMLEIKFTDPKFARYLEARVPKRDLLAFTFESTSDMNKFMQTMRSMGLKRNVNAVCSQPTNQQYNSDDIQHIGYLGFYTYLSDTISAPEPILRYLCKMYNLHKIPIGNNHTYQNSGKVPDYIRFFFTENHRFSIKVSAYSGIKSSSTVEIGRAQLLANTVDVEQIEELNEKLSRLKVTAQEHQEKIRLLDNQINHLEVDLEQLNTQRKNISEGVEKVRTVGYKITLQKKKIADIENEPTLNIEKETQIRNRGRKDCVLKQCRLHGELAEAMKKLHRVYMAGMSSHIQLRLSRQAIVQQESELRELEHELQNKKATLQNIENSLIKAKSTARIKLMAAKQCCDNKLPQDPTFPYREEFRELPVELNTMLERIAELQARVTYMDQGDENVLREYEERERTIANLMSEVNDSGDTFASLNSKIKSRLAEWLPPVETLLSKVNKSFGKMFEKISCAGEIKLDKAEDEAVEKLGVCIMVKFRSSQQLQQLSRHQQSGGERAVATALYLIALQALTTVPFRCVDEINQGMDPINERKMIDLLIKVTTKTDNTQCFLLTPKLLQNLEYNDKVMIHTIMNGRAIMDYRQWRIDRFIQGANV